MIPSLHLGLKLALRATPQGRFRSASALLMCLVGSALLVVVLSLLDAARPRSLAPGIAASDLIGMILPGIVALAIGLPVLAAATATGRMSELDRSRREARLSLLGMRSRDLALVGVGESLLPALLGAAAGIMVGALLVPVTGRVLLGMASSASVVPWAVVVALAVPLCLVSGSAAPADRLQAETPERARGDVTRRPGVWRAGILVLGIVMLVLSWTLPDMSNLMLGVLFLGGAGLTALGSMLLPALLVRASASLIIRLGTPSTIVAGRRLQTQPAALGRVLSALVIGVVVTTAAQGLIGAITSAPLYQAGRHYRDVEAVAETSTLGGPGAVAELEGALEGIDGVREVRFSTRAFIAEPGNSPGEHAFRALIASCEDLQVLRPEVAACRDDRAAWIPATAELGLGTPPRGTVELYSSVYDESIGGFGDPVLAVAVAETGLSRVQGLPARQDSDPDAMLFVPRELVSEEQIWQLGGVRARITADPRPDLPAEIQAAGVEAHIGWPAEDFAPYQATIDAIRLLNLVVLAVGLGALLLGAADLAMGRRQEHARLRLLGTPVGVLRRAHGIESMLPLVVGGGTALLVGYLVAVAFVETGNRGMDPGMWTHLSPSVLTGPALAVGVGAVMIGLLTSVGIGARLRPEHIRRA